MRDKEYIPKELLPSPVLPSLFGIIVFLASFYMVASMTWNWSFSWFNFRSFGVFATHLNYLIDGFWTLLGIAGENNQWAVYIDDAKSKGVLGSLWVHVLIPLVITLPASIAVGWFFHMACIPKLIHVNGLRYDQNPRIAMANLKHAIKKEDGGMEGGIPIHPDIPIDVGRDNRGLLITGGMGSGKTQVQLPRIKEIMRRDYRLLLNDSKGEFTQSLESDNFVLLAAWDKRSTPWHASADIFDRPSARVFSELSIKESHDPMWSSAARQVLTGMLVYLIETNPLKWTLPDLVGVMILEPEELAEIIGKYNPEALQTVRNLASKEGKTAEGIMINLQSFMSPIYDLSQAWTGATGFSIREWLREDYKGPKTIVLQGSERFKTISQGFVSTLLTFAISDMADPSFPEAKHRKSDYRVYFNLDEFPTMGYIPIFDRLVSVCRSKGAFVTLSFQDISQGHKLYGEHLINTWVSNLSNKVIGSVAVGPTASYICDKILDNREVRVPGVTTSFDAVGRPTRTLTQTPNKIPVLRPFELALELGFKAGKPYGTALYLGGGLDAVYRLKWNITKTRKVREAVVFADWVTNKKENPFIDAYPLSETINTPEAQATKDAQDQQVEEEIAARDNMDHLLSSEERSATIDNMRELVSCCGLSFNDRMEKLTDLFNRGRIGRDEYNREMQNEMSSPAPVVERSTSALPEQGQNKSSPAPFTERSVSTLSEHDKAALVAQMQNPILDDQQNEHTVSNEMCKEVGEDLKKISYSLEDDFQAPAVLRISLSVLDASLDTIAPLLQQNIRRFLQLKAELLQTEKG